MIVLDTHVLVWMIEGDALLGDKARASIERVRVGDEVLVPAICWWEITMNVRRGRMELSLDAPTWIELVLALEGFGTLSIDTAIAKMAGQLDWKHGDPADRLIVASARHHDVPLVTADRKILDYAAAGHLKAIDARV